MNGWYSKAKRKENKKTIKINREKIFQFHFVSKWTFSPILWTFYWNESKNGSSSIPAWFPLPICISKLETFELRPSFESPATNFFFSSYNRVCIVAKLKQLNCWFVQLNVGIVFRVLLFQVFFLFSFEKSSII